MRTPVATRAVALLVAAVLLGLVGGGGGVGTRAQDATPTVSGHPIVGAWRIAIALQGGLMTNVASLATFHADGTVLTGDQAVGPAPPGAPFRQVFNTAGHGAWTAAGPARAAFTFVRLQTDESGTYLGPVTVRAVAEVGGGGRTLRGSFSYDVADPAGTVVASGNGEIEGRRIGVEPPATPAAGTPAA